jgi:hypothetical protein
MTCGTLITPAQCAAAKAYIFDGLIGTFKQNLR